MVETFEPTGGASSGDEPTAEELATAEAVAEEKKSKDLEEKKAIKQAKLVDRLDDLVAFRANLQRRAPAFDTNNVPEIAMVDGVIFALQNTKGDLVVLLKEAIPWGCYMSREEKDAEG